MSEYTKRFLPDEDMGVKQEGMHHEENHYYQYLENHKNLQLPKQIKDIKREKKGRGG